MSYRQNKSFLFFTFFASAVFFSAFCSPSLETGQFERILNTRSYKELAEFDLRPAKVSHLLGKTAPYFIGLHCVNAGLTSQAIDLFEAGKKSGEPYARLSFERLTENGTLVQRFAAAEKFYRHYPTDGLAALRFAELLYENGKYERAFKFSNSISGAGLPMDVQNGFAGIRIASLMRQNDEQFLQLLRIWYTQAEMSTAHRDFYREFSAYELPEQLLEGNAAELERLKIIMQLRYAVFIERNYIKAFSFLDQIDLPLEQFPAQMLSDAGKTYLYSGKNFMQGALLFESAAPKIRDSAGRFIAYFYAGRLYEKAGNRETALVCFLQAMGAAPTSANYDNALWYYFDAVNKQSAFDILGALKSYAGKWNDPEYFDDFLDVAAYQLLSRGLWDDFVSAADIVISYAAGESAAKYAYIAARLLQEGFAKNPSPHEPVESVVHKLFTQAYSGDHVNFYYRFLAAACLSIPLEDLSVSLVLRKKNSAFKPDPQMEQLLYGYTRFFLPELVYPAFAKNPRAVSTGAAADLSRQVVAFANENPRLYYESLRIIASAVSYTDVPITHEILELLYPRPYLREVEQSARRFEISEYLLFGLLRSESFFNKDIVSHAGAIGLAQLMKPTAADIAARLKMREYDLLDPQTNILFGAWYLDNMLSRLDNSPILALFAYNGGITRVRNWIKASNSLPLDLFLETLPFAETREYGRKVLAASAMYGYLYYEKTPHEIVDEIMR